MPRETGCLLYPNYKQLGFRVPGLVVTNLAQPHRVVHEGPFQHWAFPA